MDNLLYELVVIALLSSLVIFICNKVKVAPIVGFLITGVIFGPHALGLVKEMDAVNTMADIGVVFLLFSIGMELSIKELVRLKRPVFLGGSIQVVLTILVFTLIAHSLGLPWNSAVFAGFLAAMSSTAIVMKIMQKNGMISTPAGRLTLSILIFQDMSIVPIMLVIPILAGTMAADATALALTMGRTLGMALLVFVVARKIFPRFLQAVVGTGSRELFLISVLGICLGTAYLTSLLGLSLTLGAFMAGLVVSESEYSQSALEGILPFKDALTSIFFVSVGMLMDLSYFLEHLPLVLGAAMAVLGIKAIIGGVDVRIIGFPARPAVIVGLAVCQIGEFSFVLAKIGVDEKLLAAEAYQLFLAVSILAMAATPFILQAAPWVAGRISRRESPSFLEDQETGNGSLAGHTIIVGYGLSGQLMARAARQAGISYSVLDMNAEVVRRFKKDGQPIVYGDGIHQETLERLGIREAKALVLTIYDPAGTRGMVQIARQANPDLFIAVRTNFLSEVEPLKKLGANAVIPEEFETAIEIITRLLSVYMIPTADIERFSKQVRAENYEILRSEPGAGPQVGDFLRSLPHLTMAVYEVKAGAPLDGHSFKDVSLHQNVAVTVVAVKRGDVIFSLPGGELILQAGDLAYAFIADKDVHLPAPLFAPGDGYPGDAGAEGPDTGMGNLGTTPGSHSGPAGTTGENGPAQQGENSPHLGVREKPL